MKLYMHKVIFCSLVSNCKILETSRCPNKGVVRQTVVYLQNREVDSCKNK